jgi:PAS domain S-box-containing protein
MVSQLQPTLDALPNPISLNRLAYDENGNEYDEIVYLNSAFLEQIGYTVEDIPDEFEWFKRGFDQRYSERLHAAWLNLLKNGVRTGQKSVSNTSIIVCKNGQKKWFNVTTQSKHSIDGIDGKYRTIVFLQTTSPDRNKRKLTQVSSKLNEKELILTTIIDTVPIGIFWKDKNLNYLGCNQIFAKDAGFDSPQDIIGKSDFDLVWKDDAKLYRDDDVQVIETGIAKINYEEKQVTTSGNNIWLTKSKIPLRNSKGELFGMLGSYFDITQKKEDAFALNSLNDNLETRIKEATKKRVEQEKLLIQQNKMATVGEMIANIAHQWKQPLNALSIISQDLAETYTMGKMNNEYMDKQVDTMIRTILYMSQTVEDFKNFFQPNRPKQQFNIKEVVDNTLTITKAALKEEAIEVSVDIEGEISMKGYFNELSQVLLNIINNARDALIENQPNKKLISVTIKENQKNIILTINDNAGGIKPSVIKYIFDSYFTTKELSGGTGLGLFMSRMIIEESMNGSIKVENSGEGALFTILLPR